MISVALHVLPQYLAGQDIECGKYRDRPVRLVVVGQRGAIPLFSGSPG